MYKGLIAFLVTGGVISNVIFMTGLGDVVTEKWCLYTIRWDWFLSRVCVYTVESQG